MYHARLCQTGLRLNWVVDEPQALRGDTTWPYDLEASAVISLYMKSIPS
jgi:hypothetical protein